MFAPQKRERPGFNSMELYGIHLHVGGLAQDRSR